MLEARKILLSCVLWCVVLAACSNGTNSGVATKPLASQQTLSFPLQHDLTTLDPAMIATEPESEVAQNLFDGLLK
ncbi:MAG TPA: hypothetical protein VNA65_12155, partial [Candidatus Dormibacteraeota bacterium]|nr:hypothetical protein [Candidatus Dormibacteraeota bacterium]